MANKILGAKGLTGNTGYSLDSIPSNILRSDDMAMVQHSDNNKPENVYFYKYTQNTNKNQDVPNIIIPHDSINNDIYGTWELINTYVNQDGIDDLEEKLKHNIKAKKFIVLKDQWNISSIDSYYFNITHNLRENHPIISVWNIFTNRLINVNILNINENSIRIESTEPLDIKIKILK